MEGPAVSACVCQQLGVLARPPYHATSPACTHTHTLHPGTPRPPEQTRSWAGRLSWTERKPGGRPARAAARAAPPPPLLPRWLPPGATAGGPGAAGCCRRGSCRRSHPRRQPRRQPLRQRLQTRGPHVPAGWAAAAAAPTPPLRPWRPPRRAVHRSWGAAPAAAVAAAGWARCGRTAPRQRPQPHSRWSAPGWPSHVTCLGSGQRRGPLRPLRLLRRRTARCPRPAAPRCPAGWVRPPPPGGGGPP